MMPSDHSEQRIEPLHPLYDMSGYLWESASNIRERVFRESVQFVDSINRLIDVLNVKTDPSWWNSRMMRSSKSIVQEIIREL